MRTPSLFEIRALEQWWRMNKAQNYNQFREALDMLAIPGFNIGYADVNDTIFYVSNALIPKRAPGYDWTKIVPGNTKKHFGLNIMILTKCLRFYSLLLGIFTIPITAHLSLVPLQTSPTQRTLIKTWVLKLLTTTEVFALQNS